MKLHGFSASAKMTDIEEINETNSDYCYLGSEFLYVSPLSSFHSVIFWSLCRMQSLSHWGQQLKRIVGFCCHRFWFVLNLWQISNIAPSYSSLVHFGGSISIDEIIISQRLDGDVGKIACFAVWWPSANALNCSKIANHILKVTG